MDERATLAGTDRSPRSRDPRPRATHEDAVRTCGSPATSSPSPATRARHDRVPPDPRRHHAAQQGVRLPRGRGRRRGDRQPRSRHRRVGPRLPLPSTTSSCPRTTRWTIARPEYVAVLFVFLALSVLISELLARAAERAGAAEAREAELRTIQELSRELDDAAFPARTRSRWRCSTVKQRVRVRRRGAVRRADRGRPRPGPAGDGRGAAGIGDARPGIPARPSSRPSGSRSPSEDGCSGSSS